MGKAGTALKSLQWFNRLIQFLCAVVVLAIYCYFLSTLSNHKLRITKTMRAVTGISGAAAVYGLVALALLCCLAGLMFTAGIAILLDILFIGAFIYIAVANKAGASSCKGYRDTPFGRGQGGNVAQGNGGFTVLPSYRTACKLQTAVLAVSIIAIAFFLLSILVEVALARHHQKEKKYGPGPNNDYTSGSGNKYGKYGKTGGGLLSKCFGKRKNARNASDENVLPAHTTPEQLDGRQSYATDNTAIGSRSAHTAHSPDLAKAERGYGYEANTAQYTNVNAERGYGYAATTDSAIPARSAPHHDYVEAPTQADYRYEDGTYDARSRA